MERSYPHNDTYGITNIANGDKKDIKTAQETYNFSIKAKKYIESECGNDRTFGILQTPS